MNATCENERKKECDERWKEKMKTGMKNQNKQK